MDHSITMRIGVNLLMAQDLSVTDVWTQKLCKRQNTFSTLQECEAFAHLRHIIFGQAFPDDMNSITDKMLSDFIIQSNFKWFPLDDEPEHDPG